MTAALEGDTKGDFQTRIFPKYKIILDYFKSSGAADRTRTYYPIITNDVLYQMSYSGPWHGLTRNK